MGSSKSSIAHNQRTQRTLPELMATLPQELYDQIYDEVITTHPRAVAIGRGARPHFPRPIPALLQVSRGMREHVLGSYYANTTFVCCADVYSPKEFLFPHFPEDHLSESRIRRIRLFNSQGECDCSACSSLTLSGWYLEQWRDGCGDDTNIAGFYWEGQVYAALEQEGIKFVGGRRKAPWNST